MPQPALPFEIPLWPGRDLPSIPEAEVYQVRSPDPDKPNGAVEYVSRPTLKVFLPSGIDGPVPAVVICPGGAYMRIAIDKEGIETAKWFNRLGLAAMVLKYRMPRPDICGTEVLPWPLEDGLQAIRMVRRHAAEWRIDVRRVGIAGFSAGGHLASYVAATGRDDARPDFLLLVYPVTALGEVHGTLTALLGENPPTDLVEAYSTNTLVTNRVPPTFAVHAKDDGSVPFQDTLSFQAALNAEGVPCEVCLFASGGHAFGLEGMGAKSSWPTDCEAWLRSRGILSA
ncbi:alpha/beta hydrolase [soil metagenome]